MKFPKSFLPFLFVLFSVPVSAQYELGSYSFNQTIVSYVNRDAEKIKKGNIHSRTVIREELNKNGLPSKSKTYTHYIYNEQGQILREDFYYNSRNLKRSIAYTYNEKNQVIQKSVIQGKSKKPRFVINCSYHNDSLISEIQYYRKGKKTHGYRYFYTQDAQIKEQRDYDKGKLAGRIEYDYYEDGSKKEVRYYKDSLKLEKTFRYDCGIGNSLLNEKHKDTLTRCSKKEDLGDGTIRTIEETRDEKGRIRRVVSDWNKDKKWYEYRSYDSKNRLVYSYRSETLESGKTKTVYIRYKKGKEKDQIHSVQWQDSFGFYSFQHIENEVPENQHFSTYTFRSSIN